MLRAYSALAAASHKLYKAIAQRGELDTCSVLSDVADALIDATPNDIFKFASLLLEGLMSTESKTITSVCALYAALDGISRVWPGSDELEAFCKLRFVYARLLVQDALAIIVDERDDRECAPALQNLNMAMERWTNIMCCHIEGNAHEWAAIFHEVGWLQHQNS